MNVLDAKKRTPLDICAEASLKFRGNALALATLNRLISLLISEKGISGNQDSKIGFFCAYLNNL